MLELSQQTSLSDVLRLLGTSAPGQVQTPYSPEPGTTPAFQDLLDRELSRNPSTSDAGVVNPATDQAGFEPDNHTSTQNQRPAPEALANHGELALPEVASRKSRAPVSADFLASTNTSAERGERKKSTKVDEHAVLRKPAVEVAEKQQSGKTALDVLPANNNVHTVLNKSMAGNQAVPVVAGPELSVEVAVKTAQRSKRGSQGAEQGQTLELNKKSDQATGKTGKAHKVQQSSIGEDAAQVPEKSLGGKTAPINARDRDAQEAVLRMQQVQGASNQSVSKQVQEALKVIGDAARKLGMDDTPKTEESRTLKLDTKKATRLELLRGEALSARDNRSIRVELQQGSAQVAVNVQKAVLPMAVQMALHNDGQLKGDGSLQPAREIALFNPTSPQLVMHHRIDLPAGMSPTAENFAKTLQGQLRDKLNGDIVGQAKMLLSGNGNGEIKLVLHPESLGEVRIHLKLAENAIAGTIFVDDKNVLEVFKENMAELQEAFREGGLDASLLGLQISDEQGQSASGGGQHQRENDRAFVQQAEESLLAGVPVLDPYVDASSRVDLKA